MDNARLNAMHQDRHEGDTYRRIELITGTIRRRRWTAEEKATMIAESTRPGVNVSDLARQCGVNRGLLQTWRRKAVRESAVFVPLRVEDPAAAGTDRNDSAQTPPEAVVETGSVAKTGILEIENGGMRVRFSGPVDTGALRLVLVHVGRRV
jgi:transposase